MHLSSAISGPESFVSVIVADVEAVVVRRMRLVLGLAAG
jgi:hypothetical protein